eukprot:3652063-Pleurochrysis_carterae.AAC.2
MALQVRRRVRLGARADACACRAGPGPAAGPGPRLAAAAAAPACVLSDNGWWSTRDRRFLQWVLACKQGLRVRCGRPAVGRECDSTLSPRCFRVLLSLVPAFAACSHKSVCTFSQALQASTPPCCAALQADTAEDIKREIKIMRECSCEHIVAYRDAFLREHQMRSSLWVVMEYCHVGSTLDVMRRQNAPLVEAHAAYICRGVLLALDYLHTERKTIHRDIKARGEDARREETSLFSTSVSVHSYLEDNRRCSRFPPRILPYAITSQKYHHCFIPPTDTQTHFRCALRLLESFCSAPSISLWPSVWPNTLTVLASCCVRARVRTRARMLLSESCACS